MDEETVEKLADLERRLALCRCFIYILETDEECKANPLQPSALKIYTDQRQTLEAKIAELKGEKPAPTIIGLKTAVINSEVGR